MSLSELSSKDLRTIAKLVEKKEDLLRQVGDIDSQLDRYEATPAAAKPAPARKRRAAGKKARKARKGGTRQPRGAMREKIMAELEAAGSDGVTVKELAQKLGTKPGNVSVWFYTTGSKMPNIKKVAPATYVLKG